MELQQRWLCLLQRGQIRGGPEKVLWPRRRDFVGLTSFGLEIGIFCDFRYSVLLLNAILGRFLSARPVPAAGDPRAAALRALLVLEERRVQPWARQPFSCG